MPEMNLPVITVIMPCFNAGNYLSAGIDSVLSQSFRDWELIIIDDGSSDDSLSIARKYAVEDRRIKVLSQKNLGACVARNRGILEAQGAFIKFLDADDVLDKDCLATQLGQMQSLESDEIPFGDYDYIDSNGEVLSSYEFKYLDDLKDDPIFFFYNHWEVLISSPLHRTEAIRGIGGFDEKLKRGQESDFHFRLALSGINFVYCPCHAFSYRQHNLETGITNRSKSGSIDMSAYWEYRNGKCETILKQKYGELPLKYKPGLYKFWFDKAREQYCAGNIPSGNLYLERAEQIGGKNKFQKFYVALGHLIGFKITESLMQFRLLILGKKNAKC